jgi:hypothetical protein
VARSTSTFYLERVMTSQSAFNTYGADLEKLLFLRTYPIATKMLKSESEIPEGAVPPNKDRGEHYASARSSCLCDPYGKTEGTDGRGLSL